MKKIILSLTLVLSLAMMSLTAFAASDVTASASSAEKGDTVTFTVNLAQADSTLDADVVVSGMEIVDVKDTFDLCDAGRVQLITGFEATYTCRITGEAGEKATFTLTNIKRGVNADPTPTGEADDVTTVEIAGAAEPTDPEEPTDPSNPTDPAQPTDPANPTNPTNPSTPNGGNNGSNNGSGSNNNQSGTGTANGNLDKAPNTGDATASVWPLVLIGCMGVAAAVIAGKKLAYRR